jgi:hypothetical protein
LRRIPFSIDRLQYPAYFCAETQYVAAILINGSKQGSGGVAFDDEVRERKPSNNTSFSRFQSFTSARLPKSRLNWLKKTTM